MYIGGWRFGHSIWACNKTPRLIDGWDYCRWFFFFLIITSLDLERMWRCITECCMYCIYMYIRNTIILSTRLAVYYIEPSNAFSIVFIWFSIWYWMFITCILFCTKKTRRKWGSLNLLSYICLHSSMTCVIKVIY